VLEATITLNRLETLGRRDAFCPRQFGNQWRERRLVNYSYSADWFDHYGRRVENISCQATDKGEALASKIGGDGLALLEVFNTNCAKMDLHQ